MPIQRVHLWRAGTYFNSPICRSEVWKDNCTLPWTAVPMVLGEVSYHPLHEGNQRWNMLICNGSFSVILLLASLCTSIYTRKWNNSVNHMYITSKAVLTLWVAGYDNGTVWSWLLYFRMPTENCHAARSPKKWWTQRPKWWHSVGFTMPAAGVEQLFP